MNTAHSEGIKAGEALALARLSALYEDRFVTLKESRWLDMAANEYEKAARLAAESRNKSIEGQILAQWAMLYLNAPRTNTDLVSAQNLLKKALNRAPMDGSIYAALGCAMLKTGKSPLGAKFIDQALMLDPSNWQALNEKFKIFESERRFSDAKLVLIQMNLYYPDFAQVKDLNNRLIKDMKTAAASSTPTNRGVKPTAPAGKANGSSPAKGAPDRAKSNTPPPANTAPSVSAPPPSVTPPSVIPTK